MPKPSIKDDFARSPFVYDFEICADFDELKATMQSINYNGYDLISVTQDHRGFYTLFFRRFAGG